MRPRAESQSHQGPCRRPRRLGNPPWRRTTSPRPAAPSGGSHRGTALRPLPRSTAGRRGPRPLLDRRSARDAKRRAELRGKMIIARVVLPSSPGDLRPAAHGRARDRAASRRPARARAVRNPLLTDKSASRLRPQRGVNQVVIVAGQRRHEVIGASGAHRAGARSRSGRMRGSPARWGVGHARLSICRHERSRTATCQARPRPPGWPPPASGPTATNASSTSRLPHPRPSRAERS